MVFCDDIKYSGQHSYRTHNRRGVFIGVWPGHLFDVHEAGEEKRRKARELSKGARGLFILSNLNSE